MDVILYTIHCPNCDRLKNKLDENKIIYSIIEDKQLMIDKGFKSAPILEVNQDIDGENVQHFYTYKEAVNWLKGQ